MASQNIRNILARRLRQLREQHGYSQEALADRVGLNRSYLGSIERAEHNIGVDNLSRIAAGLGVTVSRLLEPGKDPGLECTSGRY